MILLLGFGPWGKWRKNPAGLLAKDLNGTEVLGVRVEGREIPVSFRFIRHEVPRLLLTLRPRVALGLGLSPGAPAVRIERVALNLIDAKEPDADGAKPEDEPVIEGAPAAYFATVPVKRILSRLRREGIPAQLSTSAGTYCCNALFFVMLHTAASYSLNTRVGFLHLPLTPDMTVDGRQPSMDFGLMRRAVLLALEEALAESF